MAGTLKFPGQFIALLLRAQLVQCLCANLACLESASIRADPTAATYHVFIDLVVAK